MRENYLSYDKWSKLSSDEKVEFKYKFGQEIKSFEFWTNQNSFIELLLGLMIIAIIFCATAIFALIDVIMFPFMITIGFFGLTIVAFKPILILIIFYILKYKINKWVKEKGV